MRLADVSVTTILHHFRDFEVGLSLPAPRRTPILAWTVRQVGRFTRRRVENKQVNARSL